VYKRHKPTTKRVVIKIAGGEKGKLGKKKWKHLIENGWGPRNESNVREHEKPKWNNTAGEEMRRRGGTFKYTTSKYKSGVWKIWKDEQKTKGNLKGGIRERGEGGWGMGKKKNGIVHQQLRRFDNV